MLELFLDSLKDSAIIFGFVLFFNIIVSLVEDRITMKISKNEKVSPIIGSALGLVPQCGFSVVAADLYVKDHITIGTLLAVFISCSDESLPIMLTDFSKAYMILPLLLIKFVLGFCVGYLVDAIVKSRKKVNEHLEHCEHEEEIHVGCCHHHIEDESESKIHKHFLHPLLHSLKIFAYVFIINMIFGLLVYYLGENSIKTFLVNNKYLSPLFSAIVGLIPNCASSVIITELFIDGGISFGACLSGLIINAGLGTIILFKNKEFIKQGFIILGILLLVSIVSGYVCCAIFGF